MANPAIRTPDQRLRVFVSSTLGELADERAAARRAIEHLRLTPVMFELGARAHPARALYRAYGQSSSAVSIGHCGFVLMWVTGRLRQLLPLLVRTLDKRTELEPSMLGRLLFDLMAISYGLGDYRQCAQYLDQFEQIRDEVDDEAVLGAATLYQAYIASESGDIDRVEQCLDEAERLLELAGEYWLLGFSVSTRGLIASIQGDVAQAAQYQSDAFSLAQKSGNEVLALQSLVFEAMAELAMQDIDAARDLVRQTFQYLGHFAHWETAAYAFEAAAGIAVADENFEAAARLVGAADTVRGSTSAAVWPMVRGQRDSILDGMLEALGEPEVERLRAKGAELSPPQASALAREAVQ